MLMDEIKLDAGQDHGLTVVNMRLRRNQPTGERITSRMKSIHCAVIDRDDCSIQDPYITGHNRITAEQQNILANRHQDGTSIKKRNCKRMPERCQSKLRLKRDQEGPDISVFSYESPKSYGDALLSGASMVRIVLALVIFIGHVVAGLPVNLADVLSGLFQEFMTLRVLHILSIIKRARVRLIVGSYANVLPTRSENLVMGGQRRIRGNI